MVDWKLADKLRPHNRKESTKHFIVKAMVFKVIYNSKGYYVYSEHDTYLRGRFEKGIKYRVADIFAEGNGNTIIVEIETKPTKKHKKELMEFYKNQTLYIIDLRKISDNLKEMEKQIKHIMGV